MVGVLRIELRTSSLSVTRSTTELYARMGNCNKKPQFLQLRRIEAHREIYEKKTPDKSLYGSVEIITLGKICSYFKLIIIMAPNHLDLASRFAQIRFHGPHDLVNVIVG